jgi:phage-related protein
VGLFPCRAPVATIASLIVSIAADTIGLRRGLAEGQRSVDGFAASVKKAGESLAGIGARLSVGLTLPIVGAAAAAAKLGIDAVESENLFVVALGGMAKSARAFSQSLHDAYGLNRIEVNRNVASFQAMFTSMGFTEGAAFKLSSGLTRLAYDMASFYNISTSDAFTKLSAGISGETEPLRRLGINLLEARVQTVAYTSGIAKQGAVLTENQKVLARFVSLMAQTKLAQGDLARTITSPANQLRILGDRIKETATNLGTALLPTIASLISVAQSAVTVVEGLARSFAAAPPQVRTFLVVVLGLVAALGPLLVLIGGVMAAVGVIGVPFIAGAGAVIALTAGLVAFRAELGLSSITMASVVAVASSVAKAVGVMALAFGAIKLAGVISGVYAFIAANIAAIPWVGATTVAVGLLDAALGPVTIALGVLGGLSALFYFSGTAARKAAADLDSYRLSLSKLNEAQLRDTQAALEAQFRGIEDRRVQLTLHPKAPVISGGGFGAFAKALPDPEKEALDAQMAALVPRLNAVGSALGAVRAETQRTKEETQAYKDSVAELMKGLPTGVETAAQAFTELGKKVGALGANFEALTRHKPELSVAELTAETNRLLSIAGTVGGTFGGIEDVMVRTHRELEGLLRSQTDQYGEQAAKLRDMLDTLEKSKAVRLATGNAVAGDFTPIPDISKINFDINRPVPLPEQPRTKLPEGVANPFDIPGLSTFDVALRDLGTAAGATGSALASVGGRVLQALNPLNIFGAVFDQILRNLAPVFTALEKPLALIAQVVNELLAPVFEALAPVIEALIPPFRAIFSVLTPILVALVPLFNVLAIILEALFPIIKFVAIVFTYVAQIVLIAAGYFSKAVGAIIHGFGEIVLTIAKAVDKLPGVSAKGAINFAKGIVKMGDSMTAAGNEFLKAAKGMADARREIEGVAIDHTATALDTLGDTANNVSAALRNVPNAFKVAVARFAASEAVYYGAGAGPSAPPDLRPISPSQPYLPPGGGSGGGGGDAGGGPSGPETPVVYAFAAGSIVVQAQDKTGDELLESVAEAAKRKAAATTGSSADAALMLAL